MRKSIQSELNEFFAHLSQRAQLVRKVCEQAFAQARPKLSLTAIPLLNDWLIERAEHDGFVPHGKGLRLVAADASAVRFGLRCPFLATVSCLNRCLKSRVHFTHQVAPFNLIRYYFGLPGGDRTPDPQLRRLMLYPTELRAVRLSAIVTANNLRSAPHFHYTTLDY